MPYSRNIKSRTRVGGSGFTTFFWQGDPIGFAQQIATTSPTPVGPGATPIHPMDERYPLEIITPQAQNIGTITLQLWELYNYKVWDQLTTATQQNDLVGVFEAVASSANPIQMVKIITPPTLDGSTATPYAEVFHRCVITNIEDGEVIEVGTMDVSKRITVAYTYSTRTDVSTFNTGGNSAARQDLGGNIQAAPTP